jgi:hypothetical protein
MVTPGRLELPAYGLGNRRSILLSYGVTQLDQLLRALRYIKRHVSAANFPPIVCYFVPPVSRMFSPKLRLKAASKTTAAALSVGLNKWL